MKGLCSSSSVRPILLKNSLSGEKGGRVENVGLHNRATFNDLDSGKESPYPEKISFRVFQQNRPRTDGGAVSGSAAVYREEGSRSVVAVCLLLGLTGHSTS
jgi:hypothetical protein